MESQVLAVHDTDGAEMQLKKALLQLNHTACHNLMLGALGEGIKNDVYLCANQRKVPAGATID